VAWNLSGWYDSSLRSESPPKGPQSRKVASMLDAPVAHPWRRFVRLSVRGLIVLVLVIGAGLAWLGPLATPGWGI
jgi:hypothetical protein